MKNTKQPTNKPKLSSYWIYALVILFFASTYFIGGDSSTSVSKNINISSFERFLNKGEIKEVTVINKNLAQVTLQRDALNSPDHKNANSVNFLGQKNINGPHYVFEIGNLELFQNKLELARTKLNEYIKTSKIIKLVRGKGLLNAIVINDNEESERAWNICLKLKENGLLAKPTHGNIIRFAPPLTITKKQIETAVNIIIKTIKDFE